MSSAFLAAAALATAMPAPGAAPNHPTTTVQVMPSGTATSSAPLPKLGATPIPPVALPAPVRRQPKLHRHQLPSPTEQRVLAANRAATLEPAAATYLNAAQIFPWSDAAIYHVITAPGQVTDIALQPGEAMGSVAAGDTVRWVIGDTTSGNGASKQTHVLVKPFTAGLATNIVITTDRRTYHLALSSTDFTAMSSLSWTYPADQLIALKASAEQARADAPLASGLAVDQLHFDYTISGDQPAWRPLRAFDDGRQTFIEFPETIGVGDAPPLFLVDGKGTTSLVNYRVEGRYYVVDRLFDTAELRLGLKHQMVVRISRDVASAKRGRA